MKKILFIASAILILLSGCENFLDSELLTEKTTANFPMQHIYITDYQ